MNFVLRKCFIINFRQELLRFLKCQSLDEMAWAEYGFVTSPFIMAETITIRR